MYQKITLMGLDKFFFDLSNWGFEHSVNFFFKILKPTIKLNFCQIESEYSKKKKQMFRFFFDDLQNFKGLCCAFVLRQLRLIDLTVFVIRKRVA